MRYLSSRDHGYRIDNSSSWLAAKEKRSGAFNWIKDINGESFFSPGSSQPSFRNRFSSMVGQERDLIANANKAGMAGGSQKVEGSADLRVAFENAPAGAKAYMQYGGMFKSSKVDWGHAMPPSDPGGGASGGW